MNATETKQIILSIKAKYPHFNKDVADLNPLINIWKLCLADFPYQAVASAPILKKTFKQRAFV